MPDVPIAWNDQGLVPVVVQDRLTGEVRMLAWANDEAVTRTRETRLATFWSRSRAELWVKGATSGHVLAVHDVRIDCDGDALLYLVEPQGVSCHTGAASCFFRSLWAEEARAPRAPFLPMLEGEIESRRNASSTTSYVKRLLDGGAEAIGTKLREEADELARAVALEGDDRVAAEGADLLFHALVGLTSRGLGVRNVLAVLAGRFGVGGLAERASRGG